MKEVFADAFYFVALLNKTDQYHERALTTAKHLHANIITTQWVLAEVADALASSASRRKVRAFFEELQSDPGVQIIASDAHLFDRALRLYDQHQDKQWSLTDCISFTVMKDREISEALTGDRHFAQAGFRALLR